MEQDATVTGRPLYQENYEYSANRYEGTIIFFFGEFPERIGYSWKRNFNNTSDTNLKNFRWKATLPMSYIIKDENGEVMRIVGRQEEARQVTQQREGWTFKCVRKPKAKVDLSQFEEALI